MPRKQIERPRRAEGKGRRSFRKTFLREKEHSEYFGGKKNLFSVRLKIFLEGGRKASGRERGDRRIRR